MYNDYYEISFKKILKWIRAIIILVILLSPVAVITYLNVNTPVFSYKYISTQNLMQQLTSNVEFNSATKGITVRVTSDMINSYIDDEIKKMDLGLPEKIEILDVHVDTQQGRAFVNLKAYFLKLPISAAITLKQTDTTVTISFSGFKLADLPLKQEWVDKFLKGQKLTYSMRLSELDVVPYFKIKSINWKANGIDVFYEVDYQQIYNQLRRRPDRIAAELTQIIEKNQALAPMLDLVTYLANTDELTLNEIKYYLDMLLENQQVADALIDMVKSGQL
jgi:hypothetical protein